MIFGAISRLGVAKQQKKMAKNTVVPEFEQYQESPYAKEMMGLARARQNARMPGAPMMERNVLQSQANTMGAVERNSTDGATSIAAAMASQATTNQAMNNLQMMEAQNQAQNDARLAQAQGVMIGEGNKVFESREGYRREQQGRKDAFTMASQHNSASAFDGLDQAMGTVLGAALKPEGALTGILQRNDKTPKTKNRTRVPRRTSTYNYQGNDSDMA
jgi:hypothetical protein